MERGAHVAGGDSGVLPRAARRARRDYALLAALLAVAVPSLAYTGTVMTENAFYPLFLAVVLVLVVALERPTPLWVVLLLALVGLAYATRVQAVALGPAILLAPLVLALFEPRGLREAVSRFRWLYGIVAAAPRLRRSSSRSPSGGLLGAYEPVGERSYDARRGAALPLVARRRALPVRARRPARGDDRARRARPLARRAPPGVPRGDRRP